MKQLLFFTLFLFTIYNTVYAQSYRKSQEHLGTLTGEVYFITLFVDTQDDRWEPGEIEHYFSEFESSLSWLEYQAAEYDQEISFVSDFFFFDDQETVYMSKVKRGINPVKLVRDVVQARGYDNFKDFLESNDFEASVDRLKILLFVKSRGRSHAYNITRIDNVDIAVVYFQSSFGLMTDEYVISHEILHQFGAWDLYHGRSQTLESAKKAKELYPNSIMINTHSNKANLIVDELTAWRVGWEEIKPEFYQFNPGTNGSAKEFSEKNKEGGPVIKFKLGRKKKDR